MTTLRVILGDQLSHSIASLQHCDKKTDVILMAEVMTEATYVKHHKKKIIFLFSAMRHFAQELIKKGYRVHYTELTDKGNTQSISGEVERAIKKYRAKAIVTTFPGEYRVLKGMRSWQKKLGVPVEIREDDRFICSPDEFSAWANGRKQCRMEYFYRELRQKTNTLMQDGKPIGGQWNFDADNRKQPPQDATIPKTYHSKPDTITQTVIELVESRFGDHFGESQPFHFATTRRQALAALKKFIDERLPSFGDYQDAMIEGEAWMYHSHIGLYLNCGLLLPMECIEAAELAYHDGQAPLNAVEGFIRQILGWREYVRGIYWLQMPRYTKANFFNAKRKLPEFYWSGETEMNCLKQCVQETQQNAYAHHIQRLMVLGNFALLAGIDPRYVNEWYLLVYADAYEWVELPNVSGMTLFADGGLLASKPYAAGGSYIHKMSTYCQNCQYNVKDKTGENACPFNYLYWDFLARNRQLLAKNPRIGMMYKTYDRMSNEKKKVIQQDSKRFLDRL
jgi:deoxyribodipyrimidine photolyase-related protein